MSSRKNIAVSVRQLSKSYTIAHEQQKQSTFTETLLQRARHPFRRATAETFWALRDVSFDIKKGETVGIIGRNGAGKSTLLKILSRITEPTNGEIKLFGRVGSLLEVGTGFHPELTGRENVFLNGAILGMPRREITRQFDEIVAFAEVEKFLDTPVKRYSSGMYVRLAFAVAAHLGSEILVVDEVLAVGDSQFQQKCLGKMGDVAQQGRTVLYVSHQMGTVAALCSKGIFLKKGSIEMLGDIQEVIGEYLNSSGAQNQYVIDAEKLDGAKNQILSVQAQSENGSVGSEFSFSDSVRLAIKLSLPNQTDSLILGVALNNSLQTRVFSVARKTSELERVKLDSVVEVKVRLPKKLIAPNNYSFTVSLFEHNVAIHDHQECICPIKIIDDGTQYSSFEGLNYGNVIVDVTWN